MCAHEGQYSAQAENELISGHVDTKKRAAAPRRWPPLISNNQKGLNTMRTGDLTGGESSAGGRDRVRERHLKGRALRPVEKQAAAVPGCIP